MSDLQEICSLELKIDSLQAEIERLQARIAELENLATYHAMEMGCECRDCYQLREAEMYSNQPTDSGGNRE